MAKLVTLKAARDFVDGNRSVARGASFKVSEDQAAEFRARGLVEAEDGAKPANDTDRPVIGDHPEPLGDLPASNPPAGAAETEAEATGRKRTR